MKVHILWTRCGKCALLMFSHFSSNNELKMPIYKCPQNSALDFENEDFADKCKRFVPKPLTEEEKEIEEIV